MHKQYFTTLILAILCLTLIAFSRSNSMKLHFRTSAFKNGEIIPHMYTCQGLNVSPELEWQKADGAQSYVIIVDDPDAQAVTGKTFVHWIISVPATVNHIGQQASHKGHRSPKGTEYENDFGNTYYGGACPPHASGVHNYHFTLFALSISEDELKKNGTLTRGHITADQFRNLFKDQIIAEDTIIGKFGR